MIPYLAIRRQRKNNEKMNIMKFITRIKIENKSPSMLMPLNFSTFVKNSGSSFKQFLLIFFILKANRNDSILFR